MAIIANDVSFLKVTLQKISLSGWAGMSKIKSMSHWCDVFYAYSRRPRWWC